MHTSALMDEDEIFPASPDADTELPPSEQPDVSEEDPELERDYIFLAQWLLDIHRELREQKRLSEDGEIDSSR